MSWRPGALVGGTLLALAVVLLGAARSPAAPERATTIYVAGDAQFVRAERALSRSGGTIVLRPRLYRRLTISAALAATAPDRRDAQARASRTSTSTARETSRSAASRIGPVARRRARRAVAARGDVVLHDLVVRRPRPAARRRSWSPTPAGSRSGGSDFAHCGDRTPSVRELRHALPLVAPRHDRGQPLPRLPRLRLRERALRHPT